MRFPVSPPSPCLPLSPYLHLSHLSSPIFHFLTFFCSHSFLFNLFPALLFLYFLPPVFLSLQFLPNHFTSSSLLVPTTRSLATGDYCSRPEGGAHTQRAECDGAGIFFFFFYFSNENITGDPVGGDDLWRALRFCLGCSLFRKMPGHPCHRTTTTTPSCTHGWCGSALRAGRSILYVNNSPLIKKEGIGERAKLWKNWWRWKKVNYKSLWRL